MLFKKALLVTLALSSTYLTYTYADPIPPPPITTYSRVVVITQQLPWLGPVIPLDPNHQVMLSLGVYSQEDADAITNDAIADFYNLYGIDFSSNNPNVIINETTGVRTILNLAVFFPTIFNKLFVVSDTAHPERGTDQQWRDIEVGQIVQFISSGTITGGTNAGAHFEASDLYSFGQMNLLRIGADWTKKQNREVVKYSASNLSKQATNQWNNREFIIGLDVLDDQGRKGHSLAATEIIKHS